MSRESIDIYQEIARALGVPRQRVKERIYWYLYSGLCPKDPWESPRGCVEFFIDLFKESQDA